VSCLKLTKANWFRISALGLFLVWLVGLSGTFDILNFKVSSAEANTMRIAPAGGDGFIDWQSPEALAQIRMEADYIVSCQYAYDSDSVAFGAINNVHGSPTWIVPGENAIAIMGLVAASEALNSPMYKLRAELAADYLVKVQDDDGAWYIQYSYARPTKLAKHLRHTAEVMMALDKLGYKPERYDAMIKAASFLLACQDPKNKGGINDGLVCGGINAKGAYEKWRWTSDNSFAYQALVAASKWAEISGDMDRATEFEDAYERILDGLENYLFASSGDHWYRAIDCDGEPTKGEFDWINYAPLMVDVPVSLEVRSKVANWIARNLQKSDGAVVWDNEEHSSRKSPGYSFQAMLVWLDTDNIPARSISALEWAQDSLLWQQRVDRNGVRGGWIDWDEGARKAPWWQRFIDTSAYYVMVRTGGYDFGVSESTSKLATKSSESMLASK